MATTGAVAPTATVTASESPWSDADWQNHANVKLDDGNLATIVNLPLNERSTVLKASTFDFSVIPDGSTINGVTAVLNIYKSIGLNFSLDLVQLLDTSLAKVGTNLASTPVVVSDTSTSNTHTFGSSSNLWGNSLTSAWVKNSNFGIAVGILQNVGASSNTANFDFVSLEIDYTPITSIPTMRSARTRP